MDTQRPTSAYLRLDVPPPFRRSLRLRSLLAASRAASRRSAICVTISLFTTVSIGSVSASAVAAMHALARSVQYQHTSANIPSKIGGGSARYPYLFKLLWAVKVPAVVLVLYGQLDYCFLPRRGERDEEEEDGLRCKSQYDPHISPGAGPAARSRE
ncbi:hypothetical protein Landi51_12926 [Colletotrichum acutatum]